MFGVDDFIVGMVGGSIIDAFAGHSANQANIAAANANRAFSRNAHQIEVEDLYKAGLNPLLSAKYSGANLSGGTMPNVEPIARDTAGKLTSAFAARAQARLAESGVTKNDAEANLADATAAKVRTEEALLRRGLGGGRVEADIGALKASAVRDISTAKEADQRVLNLREEIPKIRAQVDNIAKHTDLMAMQKAKTISEDVFVQMETEIKRLDLKEREAVIDDLIHIIKMNRAKVDMSMPGSENAMRAQESAFRRMLSLMGFSSGEQGTILEKAGAAMLLKR